MKIKFTVVYEPKFNSALSKYFISIQLRNGKLRGFRPLQSNKDKSLTLPHPAFSSATKTAVMSEVAGDISEPRGRIWMA